MTLPIEHNSRRDLSQHDTGRLAKWLLAGCVLVLTFGIFLWSNTPYDIDDAPITYRYAKNLATGNGFVYNTGERIQGTSTPLYTLISGL